ncbi:MAG: NAD(P)-dependent oxidoreductase [Planctomycetota bacterium]|jgi:3-hydroxyisobutyrate dehydrogenase-like beta-hydroxyacid dehydrogenase|nr:NAD(P)-dependent oxidoreductase [Planctomycetota bacterium]
MRHRLDGYRIGFIGLGNMGSPMARHLNDSGAEMFVWNRSPERLNAAVAAGMRAANSPSEVAERVGAGIICINLADTAAVNSIVFGTGGLHERLDPAGMVIDFGTTGVPATRQFAQSISWVDAPVSGGQVGAESASLSIMVGGDDVAVARALPILKTVGKRVTHLGPSGAGQVTKLANQLIVAQTIDAVAQALRMAELAGVDPALARQAMLGGFADSRILELHGDRMVRRDFVAGGKATLQLKDVRLISELAEMVGLNSPTLANSLDRWEELVDRRGKGDLDHSGLFTLYE